MPVRSKTHGVTFWDDGAIIAFHGSWNRAPLPQEGYKVAFVPMQDGLPSGEFEIFADGFAGEAPIRMGEGTARPTGLAVGPDGSLYIVDGSMGKIWRIAYVGTSPTGVEN
ncbi:MAG: hypothetical protein IZT58_13710 [Actinobacteria bacterium]|nr:hypothetical protein [Actinomycetota bacterium]